MRIPTGGAPGNSPRSEISANVSAAAQVNAESVGGRLVLATISAIVVTDAKPVNIKIKIINVRIFVEDERLIQQAVHLSQIAKLPLVATNNVRFLQREDFEAHEASAFA